MPTSKPHLFDLDHLVVIEFDIDNRKMSHCSIWKHRFFFLQKLQPVGPPMSWSQMVRKAQISMYVPVGHHDDHHHHCHHPHPHHPPCRLAIQRLRGAVNAFGRSIYTACRPDQHPLRHLYSPNNASINFHAYTHARIRGASVIKCALCVQTQSPSVSGGICSGCSNVAREDACIGRKLWLVDGIISHSLF